MLAVPTSGAPLEVHPFFREDTQCSVCELMPPLASPSGIEHRFRVFLPPGYHENTLKRYPVLYMHDGHNLFLKEEAFVGNTWRTDEVINMLDKMNAIDEVIVVGIHPHDRMNGCRHCRIRGLRPVYCRKPQAADRRKISHAHWPSEYRCNGIFARWCRFLFILDGNGRRCSGRLPASRAHSRIGTICSTAFPQNQNENFGFTSIAAGRATTTKLRVACEIG